MANTATDASKTAMKVFNPYAIFVTPFNGDSRGSKTYKIVDVIKDSTSITQDDPAETKVESEFSSAPIVNNITLGSYQFSAQVADMQKDLLKDLCGYEIGTTDTDRIYAPSKYVPVFAEVVLAFKVSSEKMVGCVLPKLQLNSKATLESLSSNMGTITLAGSGQNILVQDGDSTHETPFYIDTDWKTSEL